jgi:hypothetical protein
MAGFEPAFMPPDDFLTYQQILANSGDPEVYQPWIKKMRAQDRFILSARGDPATFLPELEWKNAGGTIWLGRLPSKG